MYKKTLFFLFFISSLSIFAQKNELNLEQYQKTIEAHRLKYINDFLSEETAPIKKEDVPYIQFFDIDVKYRFEATFKKSIGEQPFDMATSSGKMKQYVKYGELTFIFEEKNTTISVYQSLSLIHHPLYKDYLFIPFKDLTTGESSYGAGRYIDTKFSEIIDNKMIIDFNKCYNPYCAYADGYSCPIPPKENTLNIGIEAGEKIFGKTRH